MGGKSFHDATENRLSRVNPSTMKVVRTGLEGKFFHNERRRQVQYRGEVLPPFTWSSRAVREIPLRAEAVSPGEYQGELVQTAVRPRG